MLHKEFQSLHYSLEFSQEQILSQDNAALKLSVKTINTQLSSVVAGNRTLKEAVVDLQTGSMRDNIIFTDIPEQNFSQTTQNKQYRTSWPNKLQLTGGWILSAASPFTVCTAWDQKTPTDQDQLLNKFKHHKQKELIQQQGTQLKGIDFDSMINTQKKSWKDVKRQKSSGNQQK